jgi:beta-glucuronidase
MITASFNHPSVIMWGFLNEGDSTVEAARPLYEELIRTTRELDATRLVTYASHRGLKDLFLEQIDVLSFNLYPAWYGSSSEEERPLADIPEAFDALIAGLDDRGLSEVPVIISEIGAGALYGFRDSHRSLWSEEYQADYLERVLWEVKARDRLSGVVFWQYCDIRTYGGTRAVGRPRSYNNKGLVDEFRRPKTGYFRLRELLRRTEN